MHCYHCGWKGGRHRRWCPDSGTAYADPEMCGAYAVHASLLTWTKYLRA